MSKTRINDSIIKDRNKLNQENQDVNIQEYSKTNKKQKKLDEDDYRSNSIKNSCYSYQSVKGSFIKSIENSITKKNKQNILKKKQDKQSSEKNKENNDNDTSSEDDDSCEENIDKYGFQQNILDNLCNDRQIHNFLKTRMDIRKAKTALKKFDSDNSKFSIYLVTKVKKENQKVNDQRQSSQSKSRRKRKGKQYRKEESIKETEDLQELTPKPKKVQRVTKVRSIYNFEQDSQMKKYDQIEEDPRQPIVQVKNIQKLTEIKINLKRIIDNITKKKKDDENTDFKIYLDNQI